MRDLLATNSAIATMRWDYHRTRKQALLTQRSLSYSLLLLVQIIMYVSTTISQSTLITVITTVEIDILITLSMPSHLSGSLQTQDDSVNYMMADGKVTNNCRFSPTYSISPGGELVVDSLAGFSTSEGIVSQPFIPTSSKGNITGTWRVWFGMLQWYNEAFLGGFATVCIDRSSNSVLVYFLKRAPLSCRPITLHYRPS